MECFNHYSVEERTLRINALNNNQNDDQNSISGTYLQVNINLNSPKFYSKYLINEYDRKILTKYRTGSNNLKINTGRFDSTDREFRFCKCGSFIQTIYHVIFECNLTQNIRNHDFNYSNLYDFFNDIDVAAGKLRCIEKILDLK